jgi:hypothetical protein
MNLILDKLKDPRAFGFLRKAVSGSMLHWVSLIYPHAFA